MAVQSSQIKEHMEVLASDGKKVGVVDHLEGTSDIKLTKTDSPDGEHHLVPMAWVEKIDKHVHLNKPANDVTTQWHAA